MFCWNSYCLLLQKIILHYEIINNIQSVNNADRIMLLLIIIIVGSPSSCHVVFTVCVGTTSYPRVCVAGLCVLQITVSLSC